VTAAAFEPGAVLEGRALGQRAGAAWLLRDCTLNLGPGCTALLGPNGAGKTTLLRVLAGICPAAGGRVWLEGRPVGPEELRRAVAYVPQFPGVHPRLSAERHLQRLAGWWGVPSPAEEAAEALERLGLTAERGTLCGALAAGQRRRLAVAEAWVRHCRVVLFDEPTADLDAQERAAFWAELAALQAERGGPAATLVTTHLLDEVVAHCAGAVVLAAGRAAFSGGLGELAARAAGACFRLRPGDQPGPPAPPPDCAVVTVETDGTLGLLAGPGRLAPPAAEPRAPTPLDGYLRLVQGLQGRIPPAGEPAAGAGAARA